MEEEGVDNVVGSVTEYIRAVEGARGNECDCTNINSILRIVKDMCHARTQVNTIVIVTAMIKLQSPRTVTESLCLYLFNMLRNQGVKEQPIWVRMLFTDDVVMRSRGLPEGRRWNWSWKNGEDKWKSED